MTIQTLTLSQIQPCAMNPRKFFNDTTIEELAQSIKTDGLLQNLVVLKPTGRAKKHTIIAGERRFRAISHLIEKGELEKDFPIKVEIKEGLSNDEALRIATVENVQRENLSPLEEAEALSVLVKDGAEMDTIIAQTGLSLTTIRRRLMLLSLAEDAKTALQEQKITLAQAEALSIGSEEAQNELLDDIINGYCSGTDEIKESLVGNLPTLSMAKFPKEDYIGTFTQDLLADADSTYFDDVDQFFELQKAAAEQLVTEYAKTHDWAELEEGYSFSRYRFGEVEEGEKGGVIVFLSTSGEITVYEGLTKTKAAQSTVKALTTAKEKDFYPTPLRRYMGMHKSLAVQAAILGNPRKAKELVVANKLANFDAHDCLRYFETESGTPPALAIINQEAAIILSDLMIEVREDKPDWKTLGSAFSCRAEKAYDAIQSLTDEQLEAISLFLETCEFGQYFADRLDTSPNSLFNKIACDLAVDMRHYWRPDAGFLKRRNRVQLQQIITDIGAGAFYGSAANYKKGELVESMSKYFRRATTDKATDTEKQANDWLPEAMAFPAVDPDHKEPEVDEDFEDDEEVLDGESDELDDEEYSEAA